VKLGIIIYSNDAETVWNAFRLANYALQQRDAVKIFLLGKGVECEALDTKQFPITQEMKECTAKGGEIFACGTCLKMRKKNPSDICFFSSMKDLYEIVHHCERILSF
jgi:uncharacterized protein involved in oxidation of intracellular sulfur